MRSLYNITHLITVGYSSVFTNTTISKAIVMPSLPTQATALFNQNIPVEDTKFKVSKSN